jgi:hypothetical protein
MASRTGGGEEYKWCGVCGTMIESRIPMTRAMKARPKFKNVEDFPNAMLLGLRSASKKCCR